MNPPDPSNSPAHQQPRTRKGFWQGFLDILAWIAALAPVVLLAKRVDDCAVNVPFMDDWQFIPLFTKAAAGQLTWAELFAPHDEHRLLLPRLIIIASVFLFKKPYIAQCLITVGVVAITSLSVLWVIGRSVGWNRRCAGIWFMANLVLFSPIQYHNWLWPMQFAYFLPFMFLALAMAFWVSPTPMPIRFGGAILCAAAGSFSFIHGLLIWPAFLPWLLQKKEGEKFAARRLVIWGIAAALATFFYFYGIHNNSALPMYAYGHRGVQPTTSTLRMLWSKPADTLGALALFAAGLFGNAFRGFPVQDNIIFSRICGGLLFLLLIGGIWAGRRIGAGKSRNGDLFRAGLSWCIFAFIAAGLISVGRTFRGFSQPLTPRYATYGTFCVLAVLLLVAAVFACRPALPQHETRDQPPRQSIGLALASVLLCFGFVSWLHGWNMMQEWAFGRWTSLAGLRFFHVLPVPDSFHRAGVPEELIGDLLARLDAINRPLAEKRADATLSGILPAKRKAAASKCDLEVVQRADGAVEMWGRAVRLGDEPAHLVLICLGKKGDDKPLIVAGAVPHAPPMQTISGYRKDFEFCFSHIPLKQEYGAFATILPSNKLSEADGLVLTAYALDQKANRIIAMPGIWQVKKEAESKFQFKRLDTARYDLGTEPEERH